MTTIHIPNHCDAAEITELEFDLQTGQFCTKDKKIIKKQDIGLVFPFKHPILTEKTLLPAKSNFYRYVYTNNAEFYLALRYIYATLLQSETPDKCFFHIQPSEKFFLDTKSLVFYFSNDVKKSATQKLSVRQFNGMMTEIYAKTFKYCDQVFLDEVLTRADLPPTINADDLYFENTQYQPFDSQTVLEKCEIRYINSKVGFGVFARCEIPKGIAIAQYCGKYMPKKNAYMNYSYKPGENCGYNLLLDAQYCGNIARFVNHAREPDDSTKSDTFLRANLLAENHPKFGNRRIMLITTRNIQQGEQLLSYYGEDYIKISKNMFGMLNNGDVIDHEQRPIKDSYAQLKTYLSIFAGYGDKRSQWALFKRPILVAAVCICLKCILSI